MNARASRILITGRQQRNRPAAMHVFGRSAESRARTAAYLATSRELDGATGLYFFHGKPARSKPVTHPGNWNHQESLEVIR